ncbi:GntR family transcriptional regulator [Branchiibius sp. NY16-3462-2]|uniref:GntR family transcriptional regulator n=1 Tax=Branchiibius sp. NY16-3462-2 TaxID=1807500 RepID=UPI0007930358|nr:GntR family transcriptional regulator [Branchiibius sp. NY16-3462-2]KYH45873.1 hypothetical protein AZH51_09310 [Branchiibius sp. NY16-3462-2]
MPTRQITDGPEPKYAQLREALTVMATRELQPDAALPSERELMRRYAVSRATVRRAIESLAADGLLHRIHGKGTFVARPRLQSDLHLASFSQDMTRRGLTPSTAILTLELDTPPAEVAEILQLPRHGRAWRLERIRFADDVPIALEDGWYPAHLLPDLDQRDLTGSLYEVLTTEYELVIDHAEQTLWGEPADAPTARRLKTPSNAALLVFQRTSFSAGIPVEYVVSRYRGDRYSIHMSLDRPDPNPKEH